MEVDRREELIQEEKKKIRRLRMLVDLTTSVLYQDSSLTLEEARQIVRGTEQAILEMFPDKQQTFDIVLLPRFERLLRERWGGGCGFHGALNDHFWDRTLDASSHTASREGQRHSGRNRGWCDLEGLGRFVGD